MIMCLGSGAFADSNLSDAEIIAQIQERYERQKVGDIVHLSDGGDYKIWERTLTIDEENPENSAIDTQYEKVNQARSLTREFSASKDFVHDTGEISTATLYATFEYGLGGEATVYDSHYGFSNWSAMTFIDLTTSTNTFLHVTTRKLTYSIKSYLTPTVFSVAVKCGISGDQK